VACSIIKELADLLAGRRNTRRQEEIASVGPEADDALKVLSAFYNYGHYITESERKDIELKYHDLYKKVSNVVKYRLLDESPYKESILRFHKALSDTEGFKKINNDTFIRQELEGNKDYFDNVLSYPLDPQQREAILSLEDNCLVISSAGSGKTMTTVGKVRYLIDVQKVDPSKILLITFTRKAAESLSNRLGVSRLKCVTFHKLALDIISDATRNKPTLVDKDFSMQVYQNLMENDPDFHSAIGDYILRSRYKMKDQFEYDSMQEYMKDRKKYGVQAYYSDMDGRPLFCKSDEESQICDYLGSRGIRFRYEEKYEFQTEDSEHRQYKPDFSIYFTDSDGNERRIYLEHFAVNEQGRTPSWFSVSDAERYLAGMEWKRNLHAERGTILIETTSADFHNGDVFEKLEKQLKEKGVRLFNGLHGEASRELAKQEQSILDTLTAFNFLLKSKGRSLRDVKAQALLGKDRTTINSIIVPFVTAYNEMEQSRKEIDFTDAIIEATNLCNNGHRPDYDYILVDEFQDISLDRYRFLQSLRRDHPLTKLFCVGDDWQSIYRFAGSDMALFKRFSEFFGYTKECRMETTYRFGEPLIELSSGFILANAEQKEKKIKPYSPDAHTKIDFISTRGREDVQSSVASLIENIPSEKSIYILGRYSFDVNILKGSVFVINESPAKTVVSYKDRKITFMTVHQSKGLESDYVLLLNCNGGTIGFPADIADDPVLKYVLSEPDAYDYGEERRVFYVGITRAKVHTYVLYDARNPSLFVKELVGDLDFQGLDEDIPDDKLCPKCKCGRVIEKYRGKAKNGNPFCVYECSNSKLGCDYRYTEFINLNRKKTKIYY